MADNILPKPVDNVDSINPVNETPKPKKSLVIDILIVIVVVGILGLLGGVVYNYLHGHNQDSKRKTDTAYIAKQAETYYELNGYYPTLSQINSSSFAAFEPNGIDRTKFKDPSSNNEQLTASPSPSSYAYQVQPDSCNNLTTKCNHFKVIAVLSSNTEYTVISKH